MTPLEDVLAASAAKHGAFATVYTGTAGVPLATTAPVKPRTLPEPLHHLLPAENLPVRSSYSVPGGTAREQLGSLVVRNQPVAWRPRQRTARCSRSSPTASTTGSATSPRTPTPPMR